MEEASRVQQNIRTLDQDRVTILKLLPPLQQRLEGRPWEYEEEALVQIMLTAMQTLVEYVASTTNDEEVKTGLTGFVTCDSIDTSALACLGTFLRRACAAERPGGQAVIGSLSKLSLCVLLQSYTALLAKSRPVVNEEVRVLVAQTPLQFEVHIAKARLIGLLEGYASIPLNELKRIHVQAAAVSEFWNFGMRAEVKGILESFYAGTKKQPRTVRLCMRVLFEKPNEEMSKSAYGTASADACHETLANEALAALMGEYKTSTYNRLAKKQRV